MMPRLWPLMVTTSNGVPGSGHLVADKAPEILGEKQYSADHELAERVAEYAARIRERNGTLHQLGEQHAVKTGRQRVHPAHPRRHPPDLLQELSRPPPHSE